MSVEARLTLTKGTFRLDAQFTAPARGVSAVFGPSGCGKTTLLRTLAGLEPRATGLLKVNNSIWQDELQFVPTHKRGVGYVFQEASLFDHLDVRKNLEFGWKRVPESKRRLDFDDVVEWMGVGKLLARTVHDLSGGEKKRVAIARSLLASPRLLLLDEPLTGLDEKSKQDILPCLESLSGHLDIPMIYVSHSADEVARLADTLLLMDSGRFSAQGPLADILSRMDTPLAERDAAFSVFECRVLEPEAPQHMSTLSLAGMDIHIPRIAAAKGRSVRLRVQARDVSLCLDRPERTSILNVLPATVVTLSEPQTKGQRLVRLDTGGRPLLALLSERSCMQLQLTSGLSVYAQIKSMALL